MNTAKLQTKLQTERKRLKENKLGKIKESEKHDRKNTKTLTRWWRGRPRETENLAKKAEEGSGRQEP